MECLLCYFESDEQTLRLHYKVVHNVDPTNPHFRNLFESATGSTHNKSGYCGWGFFTSQNKRNHVSLHHYRRLPQQVGSSRRTANLNILRRDKILEFSINFEQHRDQYSFFIGARDIDIDYRNFVPETNVQYKFHGFF